ncbi:MULTISPECIES: H-type small acid-soluble spore protein [Bacillaceae]|uniref:Small, acid-soluble spore protein H n=1 Tax=Evansella alkalicola TaxID=745819 RepID=A0ABS6JUZ5_9BACI|nr:MULTISPECIES: H-type small acid-soluble spore protein [Bacillaceae]MBU9722387.1 H-type small acid-soluble spore protein [Bacillus alkalicola]
MDIQRAQEIIESPTMINVNYHGIPVYIQQVNSNENTANVFPLDEMDHEQEVDINGLVEG